MNNVAIARVLLLCSIFGSAFCALEVQSPSSIAGSYLTPGYKWMGKQGHWRINGTLRAMNENNGCDVDDPELLGKIAIVTKDAKCGPGQKALQAKKNGAIGILITQGTVYTLNAGQKPDISDPSRLDDFPFCDFAPKGKKSDFLKVLDSNETIFVELSPDPNPTDDESIWTPVTVIFFTWSFINVVLSSYKLYNFIKYLGVQLSLAQIVLTVEIWANVWKILWSIEPASCGRGWVPFGFQTWTATYSWPFNFIATIMIAFYWQETIARHSGKTGLSTEKITSLKKMKIPAIIAIVILLVFEHVGDSLRASRATTLDFSVYVTAVIMILTAILCLLYFTINGIRVLLFLSVALSNTHSRSGAMIRKMTILLCVGALGLLIYIIGAISVIVSIPANDPVRKTASLDMLIYAGLNLTSTTQILCFTSPSDETSASRSPKSGNSGVELSNSGTATKTIETDTKV